jgi:hypothetical protein
MDPSLHHVSPAPRRKAQNRMSFPFSNLYAKIRPVERACLVVRQGRQAMHMRQNTARRTDLA